MKNIIRLAYITSFTIILTACGGGSDSSGSNSSNSGNTTSTKITAQCLEQNNAVSITSAGCQFTSGTTVQTAICESNNTVIKMLSGTNLTATQVSQQGSSFNGNGSLTLNGKTLSCV